MGEAGTECKNYIPKGESFPPRGRPIRNFPHPQGRVVPPKGETKTEFTSSPRESIPPKGETDTEFPSSPRESHPLQGGDQNGIPKPHPNGRVIPPRGRPIRNLPLPKGESFPQIRWRPKRNLPRPKGRVIPPKGETDTEIPSSPRESHSPQGGNPNGI